MASIVNDPNGRRRLQFTGIDGRRRTLRLGRVPKKTAEVVRRHVEALLLSRSTGQPVPADTLAWLAGVGSELHDKLKRTGLVASERRVTVSMLLTSYLSRQDVKASTKSVREYWGHRIVQLLGDRSVRDVTMRDAELLRDALLCSGLARATVGRQLRFVRQLFTQAVRDGLIATNPFDALRYNFREGALPQREYASVADVERLLASCSPAWRVLIGLARYAALRCPSEALLLRWGDVNLPGRRLTVTSPKTANQGKPWRLVPIMPRLAELLEEAWELAPAGAEYVVDMSQYRGKAANWVNCNVRTQFGRLMRRAGVYWRRPFRVLRSSCVTDWASEHPIHAVAAWSGHTVSVAGKHYLTVTDADFERATGGVLADARADAKSGALEAQIAAQQRPAGSGTETHVLPERLE